VRSVIAIAMLQFLWDVNVAHAQGTEVSTPPHELLRRAAVNMRTTKNLDLEAEIDYEVQVNEHLLAQYSGTMQLKMSRPDKLYVAYQDDFDDTKLWINGSNVTYLHETMGLYSQEPAKPGIDETVDDLHLKYELSLPLADVLFSDAFTEAAEFVHSAYDLGTVRLSGTPMRHFAMHGENADIQVWIDLGDEPTIHKIMIIDHGAQFAPRYVVEFTKISRPDRFKKGTFSPKLPKGAQPTKMLGFNRSDSNEN